MQAPLRVGEYALFDDFARGGMASVHFGRRVGAVGFSRTVAIKRLHPQHARSSRVVSMLIDEARLSARIHHPNVVAVHDVVQTADELLLVMEYVHGESLATLMAAPSREDRKVPPGVAVAIALDVLAGLEAAHSAVDERGALLGIVHRDVSPQNVLVSTDGVAYVVDFGIARAKGRVQATAEGQVKGKMAYVSPEQLRGEVATVRSDLYAVSVLLWEMLAGEALHLRATPAASALSVLEDEPRSVAGAEIPASLDELLKRGLAKDPSHRWERAADYATELRRVIVPAGRDVVAAWVQGRAAGSIARRDALRTSAEAFELSAAVAPRAPARRSRTKAAVLLIGAATLVLLATRGSSTNVPASTREPAAVSPAPRTSLSLESDDVRRSPAGPGPSPTPMTKAPTKPRADAASRKAARCDPPFAYENGIKVPKPGCM